MTQHHAQVIADAFNQQWPVGTHVFYVANGITTWTAVREPAAVYLLTNGRELPEAVPALLVECTEAPIALAEVIVQNINLQI